MLESLIPILTVVVVSAVLVWLFRNRNRKDDVARCDRCHKPFGTTKVSTLTKQFCPDCDAKIKSEWARNVYFKQADTSEQEKH